MKDRPELIPADVKWRPDSKPVEDGAQYKCRWVAWLPQETLADMLDDWVGPFSWWPEFQQHGDEIWCSLTVVNDAGQSVTKSDVGAVVAGDVKAGTSDAFKRCATRMWGIGREVRQVPTLWAPCGTYTSRKELQAKPNRETRPTLDSKLRSMGFTGWSSEVENGPDERAPGYVSDGPQVSNPPTPDPVDSVDDEDVAEVVRLAAGLRPLVASDSLPDGVWAEWKAANPGWQRDADKLRAATDFVLHELAAAGVDPFLDDAAGEVVADGDHSTEVDGRAGDGSGTGKDASFSASGDVPSDVSVESLPDPLVLTNTGESDTGLPSGRVGVVRETERSGPVPDLAPEGAGAGSPIDKARASVDAAKQARDEAE